MLHEVVLFSSRGIPLLVMVWWFRGMGLHQGWLEYMIPVLLEYCQVVLVAPLGSLGAYLGFR